MDHLQQTTGDEFLQPKPRLGLQMTHDAQQQSDARPWHAIALPLHHRGDCPSLLVVASETQYALQDLGTACGCPGWLSASG
jgi:hypothetical protein